MRGSLAPWLGILLSCACPTDDDDSSTPGGDCDGEEDCGDGQTCSSEGICIDVGPQYTVCPDDLQATYASIEEKILHVSCGTGGTNCHSATGSVFSGGLDMETDAWTALVGADGLGAPAQNIEGSVDGLFRVFPGESASSLIHIKLTITATGGGLYGRGMPRPTPGSVCPETVEILDEWIDGGALRD